MLSHLLIALVAAPFVTLLAAALLVAFGGGHAPPPLASLAGAARRIDTAGLPPLQALPARDGTSLAYRAYAPAGGAAAKKVALLVHGSSADSRNMHLVGRALADAGFAAYALDMRGHGASGRRGDIDHEGRLDDDIADVAAWLARRHPGAERTLVGLSSGGGFALRTAGGANGEAFDRYVMLAPMLHQDAPTARPDSGGWVRVFMPRMVGLTILERFGIRIGQQLPVIAFALPPEAAAQSTTTYSFRLQRAFRPHEDYLADVRAIRRPATVIVGANDEIFRAEAYAALLEPLQPLLKVTVLPGLGHLDVVIAPQALAAIVRAA